MFSNFETIENLFRIFVYYCYLIQSRTQFHVIRFDIKKFRIFVRFYVSLMEAQIPRAFAEFFRTVQNHQEFPVSHVGTHLALKCGKRKVIDINETKAGTHDSLTSQRATAVLGRHFRFPLFQAYAVFLDDVTLQLVQGVAPFFITVNSIGCIALIVYEAQGRWGKLKFHPEPLLSLVNACSLALRPGGKRALQW